MAVFYNRIRLLPIVVIFAVLAMIARLDAVVTGFDDLGRAYAAKEAVPEPEAAMKDATPKKDEAMHVSEQDDLMLIKEEGTGKPAEMPNSNKKNKSWQSSADTDVRFSGVQDELLSDLAARREMLDKRERELSRKEALLEAAERELNQKIKELTAVRDEIKTLMERQNKETDERISSLVKIYEGMKAKDAARIFNTLDLDVLVAVMSRMSERKTAPILASMEPERARTITIMLADQKKIPLLEGR